LNPHALAGTSPSSWRVCLFRHSDEVALEKQRPEIVARGIRPTSGLAPLIRAPQRRSEPENSRRTPRCSSYNPGKDGVVLLVDSGTLTAQYCANHSRLVLRGWALTPAMMRLQTRTVGSANSGSETM
jgi:hypothetical protein